MKVLKHFFKDSGFNIQENSDKNEHCDFLASKKGSNMVIMRYTDYYFVKELDKKFEVNELKNFHNISKRIANDMYKMPKALRLNIPNINSVLVVNYSISEDLRDYIKKLNKSLVGGEQDSIFIIEKHSNTLYSSGKELTTISGEAKVIWGNKKEFKSLNGRNRAHSVIEEFISQLKFYSLKQKR